MSGAPGATAATGLTAAEAAARLAAHGPNVLPTPPRRGAWRRLVAELVHFFAAMLWVAGGLAVLAGMPQLGLAIFVVIVVNGVFAFVQEERAERAAEHLRNLLPRSVVVRRDGEPVSIDAVEVVVGDLVVLGAGDRIPADLDLVVAEGLAIDESTLTGESDPVPAGPGDLAHAGTFVAVGRAEGVAVRTGAATRLAGIARLAGAVHRPRSPLARELDRLVRTVAVVAVGTGVGFFLLSLLLGTPARDGFLFGVGVTVALVPEGLLPTVTLSLAMGAQRMAHRNGLVRHLEAVETLGSVTFICTDKTGTLTQNRMNVVEVWTPRGSVSIDGPGYAPTGTVTGPPDARPAAALVATGARAASEGRLDRDADGGWVARGDPMEAAVDACAHRLAGTDGTAAAPPEPVVRRRLPFDPVRRRESAVVGSDLFVKGAPETVLPRCEPAARPAADAALHALAGRGLRILAVARRCGLDPEAAAHAAPEDLERDLELLGLLALQDPPRDTVTESIAAARRAGMRIAMLTGDHPATAAAIGRQIGLATGSDPPVLEGRDLPEDEQVLGALLDRDGVIVSRVSPEDKLRIARALQARGHVLAMTGDGVNDGPALQEADIGVAMGASGTDVARAAADLVLLDDDFATMVVAIEQGRATFTNIHRFLGYHLTSNVAELTPFLVWALSGGQFPLALGVLQILCLDIGTDLLPALALGNEPPSARVLDRPPERRHLIDRRLLFRVFAVIGPVEALVSMAAFVTGLAAAGWRPGDDFPTGSALLAASGAAFAAVVLGQVGNAFACRSATQPPWRIGWGTNRLLLGAVVAELTMLAGFLLVPPMARLLEHEPPPLAGFLVALTAVPAVLLADALHKELHGRRGRAPAVRRGPGAA